MTAQELPQSAGTCETLDVRGNMTVGGSLTVGGSPVTPNGITTEHVNLAAPGPVVAAKDVSFVAYTGLAPEAPLGVAVTLPNGTTDGQQKQITLAASNNITWSIAPTTFLDGAAVAFTTSKPGAAMLVWDATAVGWRLLASNGGTVA